MSLAPLLSAPVPIVVHAFAAFGALALGLVQLVGRKGTGTHRLIGWVWVALMVTVAASSFLIHTIRMVGGFSAIHLFSLFTLATLPLAVRHARCHRVALHRRAMVILFGAALVIPGLLTLLPGRIMSRVVFGG
jgi:uncharacterized membrane protein